MARIRSIKHEFFLDEELAKLDLRVRLTFPGLWTLADREGRMEDRPARIRAELYPYEPKVDMESVLAALHEAGLIQRYEVNGKRYIQVRNFLKHQRPNTREVASEIPAFEEVKAEHEPPALGFTYLVQDGSGMVKVGRTVNVEARMAELSVGCSTELKLLLVIPGGHHEGIIHGRFAGDRARGEWFKHSPELIAFAEFLIKNPNPTPAQRSAVLGLHGSAPRVIQIQGNGDLGRDPGKGMEIRTPAAAESDSIRLVFDAYRKHHPKAFIKPQPNSKEWNKVRDRLREGSTVEDLVSAIDGYHRSPFHLGANDTKTRYLDLELIVRDGSHVAKGMDLARQPEKPSTPSTYRSLG